MSWETPKSAKSDLALALVCCGLPMILGVQYLHLRKSPNKYRNCQRSPAAISQLATDEDPASHVWVLGGCMCINYKWHTYIYIYTYILLWFVLVNKFISKIIWTDSLPRRKWVWSHVISVKNLLEIHGVWRCMEYDQPDSYGFSQLLKEPIPIGSMYGIYANIGGILMVNVAIYSIHGSYGIGHWNASQSLVVLLPYSNRLARLALSSQMIG